MSKKSNEFQRLIFIIEKELSVGNIRITESAELYEYSSKSKRETDVLLECDDDGRKIKIAIECRDHKRIQDITWIDSLLGKYQDKRVDKIVAVSRSGFSKASLEKAHTYGIVPITYERIDEINWPDEFQKVDILFVRHRITSWKANVSFEEKPDTDNDTILNSLIFKDGKELDTVYKRLNSLFEKIVKPYAIKYVEKNEKKDNIENKNMLYEIHYAFDVENGCVYVNKKQYKITQIETIVPYELTYINTNTERYTYKKTQVNEASISIGEKNISGYAIQFDSSKSNRFKTYVTTIIKKKE